MKVLKFGGTSVAGADEIRRVGQIVGQAHAETSVVVVVSALGGVTDQLIALSRQAAAGDDTYPDAWQQLARRHHALTAALLPPEAAATLRPTLDQLLGELRDVLQGLYLLRELTTRSLDFLMSFGERLSSRIVAAALSAHGLDTTWVDSREVIVTDDRFGNARVDREVTYARLRARLPDNGPVCLLPGFVGATPAGQTTTLGRGGSDYTAALVAAALDASVLEIWTDVDGMMTADPRKVRQTFPLPRLSYVEALELSHFGAKVLYPPTVQPVLARNVPIRIKNTLRPEVAGTLIDQRGDAGGRTIKGISSIDEGALVTLKGSGMVGVTGIAERFFRALAARQVNVILITQASSEHSISVLVAPADAEPARQALEEAFQREIDQQLVDPVGVEGGLSVLAVVGENMRHTPNVAGRLFSALGRNGVNVHAIAQGSSEHNISWVVSHADLRKALNVVHEAFFLSDVKVLNVFVVGTGVVGGALLRQLAAQHASLRQGQSLDLRVVGVMNRRQMWLDPEGLALSAWQSKEEPAGGQATDLATFTDQMQHFNLSNSILVDCTGSTEPVHLYEPALRQGISVVTPNKLACSGPYAQYRHLKQLAARRGGGLFYETNVGAGLPVIGTLQDLVQSGDRVVRIEAILSGTLNFLFNEHSAELPFSQVVRRAKELGYSEPDPRVDLNGTDVARKILILARECGAELELSDVRMETFLPDACRDAPTLEAFFEVLPDYDDHFEAIRRRAADQGLRQRYVARYEANTIEVGLQTIPPDHPLYFVEGNDNMISFTTERYHTRPLIVKGAGAGAEVTAAGVFADVIRAGRHAAGR